MKKSLLVFLCLFLTGCLANPNLSPTSTLDNFRLPPSTATMAQVTKESTATSVQVFTPTPLPTLKPESGLQILSSWLEGNEKCRLPCWAGITPGVTEWNQAIYLLHPLEGIATIRTGTNDDCVFGKCNWITWALYSPTSEYGYFDGSSVENKIDYMQLDLTEPSSLKSLSLQNVLTHYGKPTFLLVSALPVGFGKEIPSELIMELLLVYPDRQFIIKYLRHAELKGDNFVSCGPDTYIKLIVLDNKDQLSSLNSIANSLETKDLGVLVWHKFIEEATGITIDSFEEVYSKEDPPCIITPKNIWKP